jgi:hypothetical protein
MSELASIRKRLGAARRAVRVRLFGNNQSVGINLRNRLYLRQARAAWDKRERPSPLHAAQLSEQLKLQGYLQFAPVAGQARLFEAIKVQADRAFASPENCTTPVDGAVRLRDGIKLIPEVTAAFTDDVVATVEHYFHSHFKIYWVQIYRTLPSARAPEASFLWHVDNCPAQVVKLMVYLTDTREDTGAFRLKPRPLSRRLLGQGFWDRSRAAQFASALEDRPSTTVFEGPKGTRILFLNWACIHRAKHPEVSHRDVAVFNLLPSTVPWSVHFERHRGQLSMRDEDVCPDPARY